jgi:hypothetical protein
MTTSVKKILQAVFGCAVVIGIPLAAIFNQPDVLVSRSYGTVIGAEFYPVNKWDAQTAPTVKVLSDAGNELRFAMRFPLDLKNGERVTVKVWKRRLFGYKTTYEKVELSQSN